MVYKIGAEDKRGFKNDWRASKIDKKAITKMQVPGGWSCRLWKQIYSSRSQRSKRSVRRVIKFSPP